ncbi:MAG TPA: YqgE/AlgH family protein, partial [Lacipirellulaceae bacterium]|nr:YqgE/AlgH family protein [Lacipirellulaceae bacterium]
MNSLAGHFLVASPHLRDPNFTRSVVLMLQHEEQGALGVVINRPGDKTVDEVWAMIGGKPPGSDELVYVGGPVPGPLIALHDQRRLAEREILADLFMSMQKDAIDELVKDHSARCRLFSGHSGWGAGQLDGELTVGGWLTIRAETADVFAPHDGIWKEVCGRIGRRIIAPNIPPERLPPDPEL